MRNAPAASDRIAVTYARGALGASRTALAARESKFGATMLRELDFPHAGLTTHILAVAPAQLQSVEAALRSQPGVKSVGPAGSRRYPTAVSAPYFPNDPYFNGFAASRHVPPYDESATNPGQWDMHATRLDDAFAYAQPGNGSTVTNPAALGSSSIKIAVIDSGEDASHPELHAKIVYQRCFVTNASGAQSTSNFATDPDGHGTDVSGLAAAATNNGLGFAGNGGNAVLYGYRVLPTPDDNCLNATSTDPQCGADSGDIASAISDAVAQGVNVINLSLGGGTCTSGADPDPAEGNAIQDAIAAKVIVVAAAGNDSAATVSAPGCDSGVIAAGASALDDGQPNGSGVVRGSVGAPVEYVASYSDHGSPGAAPNNPAAWGIVAPGGDPVGNMDADDLHWIENIYTSTPFDTKFAGSCTPDFGSTTGVADCRTLIAGTSMASPAVAGAAALILAVNSSYQSPAAMKQLLCATAHDIGAPNEGCGRLNIYRAMATALGDPSPPAP